MGGDETDPNGALEDYIESNNEFGGQKLGSEAFIWSMSLMDKGNGVKKAPCWSMSSVDKVCREEQAPFH